MITPASSNNQLKTYHYVKYRNTGSRSMSRSQLTTSLVCGMTNFPQPADLQCSCPSPNTADTECNRFLVCTAIHTHTQPVNIFYKANFDVTIILQHAIHTCLHHPSLSPAHCCTLFCRAYKTLPQCLCDSLP